MNYYPPIGATHVDITFNFTLYDENITSEFLLELLIGGNKPLKPYKYEQKYKMLSTNQTNVYSKTFYLTLNDVSGGWTTDKSIGFKFSTGANTKYLFISDLDDTNYKTSNVQIPSIEIKPQFY